MGVFNWPIRLDSMEGQQSLEIEALVDTGASYTVVPTHLLNDLGVSPMDKIGLVLADGRPVEYDIGEARATIDGRSIPTPGGLRGGQRPRPAGRLHTGRAAPGGGPHPRQAHPSPARLGVDTRPYSEPDFGHFSLLVGNVWISPVRACLGFVIRIVETVSSETPCLRN